MPCKPMTIEATRIIDKTMWDRTADGFMVFSLDAVAGEYEVHRVDVGRKDHCEQDEGFDLVFGHGVLLMRSQRGSHF